MQFTALPNDLVRDPQLTLAARGVLGLLLSYPDGEMPYDDIIGGVPDDSDAVQSAHAAVAELVDRGLVKRNRGYLWVIQ